MSEAPALVPLLPFRFLLDESVRQARRHFRRIYAAVAVPMALVAGVLPFAQRFIQPTQGAAPRFPTPGSMEGFAAFFAVMLAFLAVYTVGYAALLIAAVDAQAGREVDMARAWRFVLRPRVLGTLLLGVAGVSLATTCCVLPGIYVGLVFALGVPVMVEEGRFGTGALRRSAELMGYNPRRQLDADPRVKVFAVFFVGFLLGYVMNLTVQLPLIVFQQVILFRDIASGRQPDPAALMQRFVWLQVLSQIIGMLINTAIHLFVAFGFALLFFDIRGRKEAPDLEAAIGRLALSRPGATAP